VQALHGEGVAGDDAGDGEHAHGDGAVEGPDEAVAVAIEPLAVAVVHPRTQVVLVERVLREILRKSICLFISSAHESCYS